MLTFIGKIINTFLMTGLIVTGSYLAFGYLLFRFGFNLNGVAGELFGLSAFFGWFFAAASIVAFLIGSLLLWTGYLSEFWKDFYPVNFGVALLGVVFVMYNPAIHPIELILVLAMYAVVAAILFRNIFSSYPRLLWLVLMFALYLKRDFWGRLVISIIFISFFVVNGGVRSNYEFWRKKIVKM